MKNYTFFEIEIYEKQKTAVVFLNRPEKRNALNTPFWFELPEVIAELEADKRIRCVIIAGRGKSFTTGLDLEEFFKDYQELVQAHTGDKREELYNLIVKMQKGMNSISEGDNVYIVAVHKHCIGAGLDLAATCDLRLCSADALFSLRETKVAIVADMGSLNRLPNIIGQGNTRMMAFTGRDFSAFEVNQMGLVNQVYESRKEMMTGALELAAEIAANPTMAVRGSKRILNYCIDHPLTDSLDRVLLWNTAFIDTLDLREMLDAFQSRRRPQSKD